LRSGGLGLISGKLVGKDRLFLFAGLMFVTDELSLALKAQLLKNKK